MKNFLSNPNPDGCGPYGQHLTGAVAWQKAYHIGHGAVASAILVANRDWISPIPPPSAALTFDAIYVQVSVGGVTSFARMAVYDMSTFPGGTLLGDTGEFATDVAGVKTVVLPAPITVPINGRYAIAIAGRGVTLATLYTGGPHSQQSWLGGDPTNPGYSIGKVDYTRAYAAFPAVYNGVYLSTGLYRVAHCLRLP